MYAYLFSPLSIYGGHFEISTVVAFCYASFCYTFLAWMLGYTTCRLTNFIDISKWADSNVYLKKSIFKTKFVSLSCQRLSTKYRYNKCIYCRVMINIYYVIVIHVIIIIIWNVWILLLLKCLKSHHYMDGNVQYVVNVQVLMKTMKKKKLVFYSFYLLIQFWILTCQSVVHG